jgi:hypothetical protein
VHGETLPPVGTSTSLMVVERRCWLFGHISLDLQNFITEVLKTSESDTGNEWGSVQQFKKV